MRKASEIIRRKLMDEGGRARIPQLQKGKYAEIQLIGNNSLASDKLPSFNLSLDVFDIVVDFIREQGGKARKGGGRSPDSKVGYGQCTKDTIMYCVATKYFGCSIGESTFDPIFIIAAVLDWAGVAYNKVGSITLKYGF